MPTTLVIFGATGHLAKSKLFRALYSMFKKRMLSDRFEIVGFARSSLFDNEFREIIRESAKTKSKKFLEQARYQSGLFEDFEAYKKLGEQLACIDAKFKTCCNKLFYLAVAPRYYKTILENLSRSGLTIPCTNGEGWTRILVEKPFGSDAQAARELDEYLARLFREEQIFRIDHYLSLIHI